MMNDRLAKYRAEALEKTLRWLISLVNADPDPTVRKYASEVQARIEGVVAAAVEAIRLQHRAKALIQEGGRRGDTKRRRASAA